MIRNIKVNKGYVNGLVQIVGSEVVKNSIKHMSGIVKFNGKEIGKLTEECLELNDFALNSTIASELIDSITPIVENKYCYLTLFNKTVIKEDKLKASREDFDARQKQFSAAAKQASEKKSTAKQASTKQAKDLKLVDSSAIDTASSATSNNGNYVTV